MNTIHILNGDALNERFPTAIFGKKIIFRECFVDGPVDFDSFEELVLGRAKFLKEEYPGTLEKPYEESVAPELEAIFTISDSDNIYCWFEADLFCQVNFWFTLHALAHHSGKIALVLPESLNLTYGFSSLDENGLIEAYRSTIWLDKNQRNILKSLWEIFQKGNVEEAISLAKRATNELPFLLPAIEAWKESLAQDDFPGKPKQTLIEIRNELKTDRFDLVYREFHKRLPIYGYGDLMVHRLWKEVVKEFDLSS